MKLVKSAALAAAMLAVPGAAWATDCSRWADHAPGYCGVLGNDAQCANPANRVPGRCAIPAAAWYVDNHGQLVDNRAQSVMAAAGTFDLRNPNGSAVSLIAAGAGNLIAAGAGNLVAAGAGNLVGGRSIMGTPGKKLFVLQR